MWGIKTNIKGICLCWNIEDKFIRSLVSVNQVFILVKNLFGLFGSLDDVFDLFIQTDIFTDL